MRDIRKAFIVTFSIFLLYIYTPQSLANDNINYSFTKKPCSKNKLNTIVKNKICLKNGKVYRWAVLDNKQSISETNSVDSMSPKHYYDTNFLNYNECNVNFPYWENINGRFNSSYKIKVIPFQTEDYKSSKAPKEEWGEFFTYFHQTLKNLSDVKTNHVIDIENKYIDLPINLKSLDLGSKYDHGDISVRPRTTKLFSLAVQKLDPDIDFSKYDAIWLVPTISVPTTVLSNFIIEGPVLTQEKRFMVGLYLGSRPNDFFDKEIDNKSLPLIIHEWLVHITSSLDDTYGDMHYYNGVGNYGTGLWSNTSNFSVDFLGYNKWQLGMLSNSQISCVDKNKTYFVWLNPLQSTNISNKLGIIKVDKYVAITIQSMRSLGYNYKLPINQNGVLVSEINTEKMYDNNVHGDGQYVICPNRDNEAKIHGGCKTKELYEAALKLNETVSYKGYKITVVDSGDFGDVVKIEYIGL